MMFKLHGAVLVIKVNKFVKLSSWLRSGKISWRLDYVFIDAGCSGVVFTKQQLLIDSLQMSDALMGPHKLRVRSAPSSYLIEMIKYLLHVALGHRN